MNSETLTRVYTNKEDREIIQAIIATMIERKISLSRAVNILDATKAAINLCPVSEVSLPSESDLIVAHNGRIQFGPIVQDILLRGV